MKYVLMKNGCFLCVDKKLRFVKFSRLVARLSNRTPQPSDVRTWRTASAASSWARYHFRFYGLTVVRVD